MTYKENTPTFNTGNRKIVNYKDFIQHEPEEEAELKKMKRQFKKADQVNAVNQDHQSKYNKVTHKNDDLVKAEVQDKLDALEEGFFSDRYKDDPFSEEPKRVKLSNNIKSEIKAAFENTVMSARTNSPKEAYDYAERMANNIIRLIEERN
jgi:hypothetical protein